MRIPSAVRTRVPGEGSSAQGKSGPKVRPKGVADGQQVKIPALHDWSDGGTHSDRRTGATEKPGDVSRLSGSENLPDTWLRCGGTFFGRVVSEFMVPRKASKR